MVASLLFVASVFVAVANVELHVNVAYIGKLSDGTLARPFRSLRQAKAHLIQMIGRETSGRVTVAIAPGVYPPLMLDHPALSSVVWTGMEGEDPPVFSGGIRVPESRFTKYSDTAYVANIDGIGACVYISARSLVWSATRIVAVGLGAAVMPAVHSMHCRVFCFDAKYN